MSVKSVDGGLLSLQGDIPIILSGRPCSMALDSVQDAGIDLIRSSSSLPVLKGSRISRN